MSSPEWAPADWLARWRMIPAPTRRLVIGFLALVALGAWALALLVAEN